MRTKGISICGRKINDGIDFYKTPTWAVEKLIEKISFNGEVLEPASGSGAISKVLEANGYKVISQDIRIDDSVYGRKGQDIFEIKDMKVKNTITNPPYYCAQDFVLKSLELTEEKVALLLKLQFLEGAKRYEFFKNTPLKYVLVFCKRITMYPEGQEKPKNSGTIAYAWFIWEHGYKGRPQIDWLI